MNNNSPFRPGDSVVAYLRDSGGEEQEQSVSQQETAIVNYSHANGLILTQIFRDAARPGSSVVGREGFQSMMTHFRHGASEAGLIIWSYSRFARDIDDAAFYRADLRRRGYVLHSLNDSIPEGHMGRLFEAVIDWKNQTFLEDLSRDVKRGLRSLVEQYGAVPGTPPRGFARKPIQISTHRDGRPRIVHRWEPDPASIPLIRQAFRMFLEGASLAEIQIATRLYGSVNSFSTFFSNPIYKGTLVFGDLVIDNYCEPVIDPATWAQAQTLLASRAHSRHLTGDNPSHPRRLDSTYLLSGLVYCARCGSPLSGISIRQSPDDVYQRYACSRQKRNHDCAALSMPRLFLEGMIFDALKDIILTPVNLTANQETIVRSTTTRQAELTQAITEQKRHLAAVRRRIANITNALADEGSSRALLAKLAALEIEEADILTKITALESQAAETFTPQPAPTIEQQSARLQAILAGDDPQLIRHALRGLVKRITVERDGSTVRAQIEHFYPPEEHPPPSDDIISKVGSPLGAPLYRQQFSISISRTWTRKSYQRRK